MAKKAARRGTDEFARENLYNIVRYTDLKGNCSCSSDMVLLVDYIFDRRRRDDTFMVECDKTKIALGCHRGRGGWAMEVLDLHTEDGPRVVDEVREPNRDFLVDHLPKMIGFAKYLRTK